jgi:hypothetical protein
MTDHLDPRRYHMQLLADLLADDLELGAILGAVTGLFGQLVNDLDAGQLGRQSKAAAARATLGWCSRLGFRLGRGRLVGSVGVFLIHGHFGLVDEQITLFDAVLLGRGTESAFNGQLELLEKRLFGGFPLRLLLLHQAMEARNFLLLSPDLALQLRDAGGRKRG